ncbi:MAG: membrane-bound PQQ-dependent dehydrogenase, glucose/quinate/shikimate family [Comamonas sp.]|nr:membrane-bound PQQ-dependent dehydrogenase, glucose/quinate/shikimate family [Comamonas sp.]
MRALTLLLLAILGLPLTFGGSYLLALGGSPFYLFSGVVVLITAFGVLKRKRWATPVYAIWLLVLLAWSLWESGLHWWPLATRLGLPAIIGFIMAIPASRRSAAGAAPFAAGMPVLAASILSAVIAFIGIPFHLHETAGKLSMEVVNPDAKTGDTPAAEGDWTAYAGSHHGQRFSKLKQITPDNVNQLDVAWQIRTGDMKGPGDVGETTYQATPLKIGDSLYLCTPHSLAIALDADTGAEKWRFDPQAGMESNRQHQTCRGVAFYADAPATLAAATAVAPTAAAASAAQCKHRIFLPSSNAKLYALDAETGKLCEDFGDKGAIDLTHNMPNKQPGYLNPTSPPVIAGDTLIIGASVNDNYAVESPSGVIRAYDVHSGKLLWNWDSGNPDATEPFDPANPNQVYKASSPNSWTVFSADTELGMVYVPMGNRVPDQLGQYRNADEEKYTAAIVALDLKSGKLRWYQQTVHHDLWDMDLGSQPVLLDLDLPKGRTPALVLPTKQGDVYVLDRRDGTPIHAVTERPAPQGTDVPGEHTVPTQPVSALSFEPPKLTESDMWGASLIDQMMCRIQFKKLRYEGRYTAPSLQGTLVYPGNFGTFNWGSVAVDPQRQVMFGMPTYLAFVSTLIPRDQLKGDTVMNLGEQGINANEGAGYAVKMHPFLSPMGVPCQTPPWGTVAAADLRTGKIAYQYRNGTIRDLSPIPLPIKVGVPGIGGPLMTASGVAFLGAAVDNNFRAYDVATGDVLWNARLPAGGQATPMTYLNSQGEQIVVLVAGGHGSIGTKAGDYVIAYKLKK